MIPPMLIIQGKHVMLDWFTANTDPDIVCYTSEAGFTSNDLAIRYLEHFIKHTNSSQDSRWKILLMDNHGSHETGDIIRLAFDHKILLYPLLAHLTHCMQPLDVGCFQPYKHWHDKAIKESLAVFDTEYGIRSFLRDLPEIRAKTFKKDTIRHAFRDSGMWPVSPSRCIRKLKVYRASEPSEEEPELPRFPRFPQRPTTPCDLNQVEQSLIWIQQKVQEIGSSPTRTTVTSIVVGTQAVVAEAQLQQNLLGQYQKAREEEQQRKITKRSRAIKYGPYTGADAEKRLQEVALPSLQINKFTFTNLNR
jgi:DDE superfamily endonuclease